MPAPTDGLNTTENQRKYREQRAIANEPILTSGTSDRIEPGEDEFTLTRMDREELGIRENEDYAWIRDDKYWAGKVPGNRFQQWRRENRAPDGTMPGRMITQDGEPFRNGTDLVLVALPKEVKQIARDREKQEFDEWQRQIEGAQRTERMDDSDFNPSDRDALLRMKHAGMRNNRNSGMIGTGPSAGRPFEAYVRDAGLTEAQMWAEELSFARGGRHGRESNDVTTPEPRAQERRGSTTTYSLPPNVRPRNLAKK